MMNPDFAIVETLLSKNKYKESTAANMRLIK